MKNEKKIVKLNSDNHQNIILNSIFRNGNLYNKVVFHHDKAKIHMSRSAMTFMNRLTQETWIMAIPTNIISVISPDLAPVDFCVNNLW